MSEELVHEIDHHIQPETVGLNYVLFFQFYLLYCIYQCIVQVFAHTHDLTLLEMLNPGGQV